jgi:hypothetical protein
MVCKDDCCKRQIGRSEQRNQLEAKIYRRRTFCQLAGKCKRLELSRSRYWGIPLPIWRTDDLKEEKIIGSVEELYNEIEKSIAAGLMTENPFKGFESEICLNLTMSLWTFTKM